MDVIREYMNFPVTNPTWVFFIVLAIILLAPIVFSKLRIPHIIGMIIAGMVVGEHGLNMLERGESFRLFGQVGIYYIMFLAGLEMDQAGLKQNRKSGITFGLLTALIPFVLGWVSGYYLLHYSMTASLLLACIFASHTLVAYPLVGRYGIARHKSVQISVVATMIALLFALVTLAVLSGHFNGEGGWRFWLFFTLKAAVFLTVLFYLIPKVIRLFFRKVSDPVVQYIFVLTVMFLAAAMADFCGLEGILGAFLAGLVFNRYIPHSSPLMNRVEFVGNAIFIPFFLIGVGMLVNIQPLFSSTEPIVVVTVMVVAGTLSKLVAADLARRMFKLSGTSGLMMFGLTEAHAAGALAMVMVGTSLTYPDGSPLMNNDVLDGVVVMILLSCAISSFATERAAKQIKLDNDERAAGELPRNDDEKILVPINEPQTISDIVTTAILMRNQKLNRGIICLNVVNDDDQTQQWMAHSKECLSRAERICAAADVSVQTQSRLAVTFVNGVIHAFRENDASEIIIGLHRKRTPGDSLIGRFAQGLIDGLNRQVTIVNYRMPVNTIRRIVVAVPERAEYESGFYRWIERVERVAKETGCAIHFHATEQTCNLIRAYLNLYHEGNRTQYYAFNMREGLEQLAGQVNADHLLVIVSARKGSISNVVNLHKLQQTLQKHFQQCSLMLIFPDQSGQDEERSSFTAPMLKEQYQTSFITNWLTKWIRKIS